MPINTAAAKADECPDLFFDGFRISLRYIIRKLSGGDFIDDY
jgi:hypothetical protein